MPAPRVSVLLTTYNRSRALACVLEGYARQSITDIELLVGDDGSDDDTRDVVDQYAAKLPFRLRYIHQEHRDHGRTRMINALVRASESDYIIQSDGDCIPEPNYVEEHLAARGPGYFLNGRRWMMPKTYLDITPEQVVAGEHTKADVAKSRREIAMLRWKWRAYRLLSPWCWDRLRLLGANVSMWKQDFEAINGFDEGYIGWGAADEDLRRRLHRAGVRWRDVSHSAIVWHIPHPPVESKPKKVKEGRNAGRYNTRCFFTQPVRGLVVRPAQSLSLIDPGDMPRGTRTIKTSRGARELHHDLGIVMNSTMGRLGDPNMRAEVVAGLVLPTGDVAAARRLLGESKIRMLLAPPSVIEHLGEMPAHWLVSYNEAPAGLDKSWKPIHRDWIRQLVAEAFAGNAAQHSELVRQVEAHTTV